jgi:hypothetical protein
MAKTKLDKTNPPGKRAITGAAGRGRHQLARD